jgi:hypothetical protein
MNFKRKVHCVVLSLFLFLIVGQYADAEESRPREPFARRSAVLPPSAPEKERLVWVSVITIAPEADVIAAIGLYDDPETERPVDYVELYDSRGGLMGIGWVDRYGILRIAVDRGLLGGEPAVLEGLFVLLPEGNAV